ncbi:MAG: acyltransferase [Verrucomicrobia bacterium]|nr:acyltransferase [Verrucomicrobiota bacterium]
MSAASPARNPGLDAMRATAIVLVIGCHFARPLEAFGVLGVELFFVLSGFLIGGILVRLVLSRPSFGGAELRNFWARRWFRTLPAFYLFLLVNLAWMALGGPAAPARELWLYPIFSQNLLWPAGGFFAIAWSLAVEEWFYLLFPLAVLIALRLLPRRAALWAALGLFLVVPALLRGWLGQAGDWDESVRKVVLLRLDALMFGVALALVQRTEPALWDGLVRRRHLLAALGGVCAVASPLLLPRLAALGSWPLAAGFSLLPAALALTLPWWHALRLPWPRLETASERVSLYSYSMYLCHVPVLIAGNALGQATLGGMAGKIAAKPLALVAVYLLSAALYRWVEQPFLRRRPREA